MEKGIVLVLRNEIDQILLIKDTNDEWTLPNDTCEIQDAESCVINTAKHELGLSLKAFRHKGQFLYAHSICYKVFHSVTDSQPLKNIQYLWTDEVNLPNNLGELTKSQLRLEFSINRLKINNTLKYL